MCVWRLTPYLSHNTVIYGWESVGQTVFRKIFQEIYMDSGVGKKWKYRWNLPFSLYLSITMSNSTLMENEFGTFGIIFSTRNCAGFPNPSTKHFYGGYWTKNVIAEHIFTDNPMIDGKWDPKKICFFGPPRNSTKYMSSPPQIFTWPHCPGLELWFCFRTEKQ